MIDRIRQFADAVFQDIGAAIEPVADGKLKSSKVGYRRLITIQQDQDFRDLVSGGGTPTKDQEDMFIALQKVCYGEGVAHADH